jgi:hypothetical protein
LSLAPYGSACVVFFREQAAAKGTVATVEALRLASPRAVYSQLLEGPWTLKFLDERGAPSQLVADSLQLWNTFADTSIRYYSGTVSYSLSFNLPDSVAHYRSCLLQLGQVYDIAAIKINGQDAGVLWTAPYSLDITSYLKKGRNDLELLVTNRWINRLIGDAQKDVKTKYTFSTYQHYTAGSVLVPSGLQGPVELLLYE